MLRRILVVAMVIGLGACARFAMHRAPMMVVIVPPPPAVAPKPAEGLWAMLDPGCAKPSAADIHAWPHCASPFWISGDKATVLLAANSGKRTIHDVSYAADVSLTAGEPLIAQVGTQKDGYLFLALTNLAEDARGRLVGAIGAAVACPKPKDGGILLKPALNGCDLESVETVRAAAQLALRDRSSLTEVAWIAAGNP
ncbi:MAG TPA: hypothetical protein VKQ70_02300 [Caulobacteraceae bacterium]|nr:hypothetical protein [Caulobacteraceae bacterium]